jgi:hypothetical protein
MILRYNYPGDGEQIAGQFQASYFDEDGGWWNGVMQAGAVFALATTLALTTASTTLASSVFSQSQDDPAGSLFTIQTPANEDYWQNPVPPYNWPQTSVFTDDDAHPTFIQTFTPDDGDYWHQLVQPVPASNYVNLPFLDPEEIPVGSFPAFTPALEGQDLWAPQLPPSDPDWDLLLFLDDGSWVPAFQPDEDFLATQALPSPVVWAQPAQPFQEADDDFFSQQFVADEQYGWPIVPPVPNTLALLQPFVFETNDPVNLVAFTDEIYWQQLVSPLPASLLWPQQWSFEQTDATGSLTLTLDDGFQPNFQPFVPFPDQGGLRLLQQWPFEQNEAAGSLYALHDEDFWQNAVAPVNWLPPVNWTGLSALGYDDVIGTPSTSTIEETYLNAGLAGWMVAPVQDLNRIALPYLPDPEEIPAGSLVPFVPPAPCFMPLPPCGPDVDTCISTFSGFKNGPILTLFCRICMSGRPLVVRGDYAIWCQDCCAFVSKQDTYMGTVRAPGSFRGVF